MILQSHFNENPLQKKSEVTVIYIFIFSYLPIYRLLSKQCIKAVFSYRQSNWTTASSC